VGEGRWAKSGYGKLKFTLSDILQTLMRHNADICCMSHDRLQHSWLVASSWQGLHPRFKGLQGRLL